MTTPTRRQFLLTLAGLTAAPFIAARALAAAKLAYTLGIDPSHGPDRSDQYVVRVQGRAIKVPSNRHMVKIYTWPAHPDRDPPTRVQPSYFGNWDSTFKLEVCDNPAYVLADLMEHDAAEWISAGWRLNDWRALYHWGVYCDECRLTTVNWVCKGSPDATSFRISMDQFQRWARWTVREPDRFQLSDADWANNRAFVAWENRT